MKLKKTLCLLTATVLSMSFMVTAFGASSTKSTQASLGGINYTLTSQIATIGTNVSGKANLGSNKLFKPGHTVEAFVYDSQGYLYESRWKANIEPDWALSIQTESFNGGSGSYYCLSKAEIHDGSGNWKNISVSTNTISAKSLAIVDEFEANYEKALLTDGMIKAVGEDEVKGWVYVNELKPAYTTIEEALEAMELTKTDRFINLYDEDGITVIGEFKISAIEE